MIGADDHPQQVRHDEAHEADHPADRNGHRGRDGNDDQQQYLKPPHVDPQVDRGPLAHEGHVHCRREHQQPDQRGRSNRRYQQHVAPGGLP